MRDTGCPPFFDVLSYLICIVLSFAMIRYMLLWLSLAGPQTVPLLGCETFPSIYPFSEMPGIRSMYHERKQAQLGLRFSGSGPENPLKPSGYEM